MMMPLRKFKSLHHIVDQIFQESNGNGLSWMQLAQKAGLGYATVCRLGNYTTMYPRVQTILLLAQAVGFRVALVEQASSGKRPKLRVISA